MNEVTNKIKSIIYIKKRWYIAKYVFLVMLQELKKNLNISLFL